MRHSIVAMLMSAGLAGCGQADRSPPFNQNLKPGEVITLVEDRASIFFDQDSARLNREALAVVDALDPVYWLSNAVLVEITGYVDQKGSPVYNRALALRRAEAVRDAFVARGVRRDVLVTRSAGEDDPLVPTANGKDEPQNRRVDINVRRS